MVARSASQAGGFVPEEPPRVAVAADGTVATIHESSRVTILEVPSGVAFAEIGVDPDAAASEVAWLGSPPRLLVLSRYAAHSTAHLLDPYGPRTIAEIRLEAPMRLYATVGTAALTVGTVGAVVLVAGESHLVPYQFPTRAVPLTAGAAASQFVVALTGSIEEWDPQSRMPKRRLRLPRAAAITAVGGSERLVWMTTQQEPARVDVIPLVNRGQPKAHDLPERIASITGHPRSDLIACIGAETGQIYVIDLDGRFPRRTLGADGLDQIDRVESIGLVIGRMVGVIAAQARRPIAIVPFEADGEPGSLFGRGELAAASGTRSGSVRIPPPSPPVIEPDDEPDGTEVDRDAADGPAVSTLTEEGPVAPPMKRVPAPIAPAMPTVAPTSAATPAGTPPATPAATMDRMRTAPMFTRSRPAPASQPPPLAGSPPLAARPAAALSPAFRQPAAAMPRTQPAIAVEPRPSPSDSGRFSAWRDVRQGHHSDHGDHDGHGSHDGHSDPEIAIPRAPAAPVRSDAASWRDEVVAWSRAATSGAIDPSVPTAPAIEAVIARLDLAPALHPALVLLYGAHLCGERGAAPVDVARVLEHSVGKPWDEALGRGELAGRGIAEYLRSRVALVPAVLRVLDELPPLTGTLVGEPGPVALLGPCVVVAGDEPLTAIAERCLAHVSGAILAARADVDRAALLFEARAHGAAPMLRAAITASPSDAAIYVIDDQDLAERLGLPRLG